MSLRNHDRSSALAAQPFSAFLSSGPPGYSPFGDFPVRNGPISGGANAPPPYSASEPNDITESIRIPAIDMENESFLPLQLNSKIPIAHEAEVLKMLLRSGGVDVAQIGNSVSSGEEQLPSTHLASIHFSCGRDVNYVLTRVNGNSIIIGTWVEPVYGRIHVKKAVRNLLDAFSWPIGEIKISQEVHPQEYYSYLNTDFQHILVQPPRLDRWTWEKPANLCSSCKRLR